MLNAVIDINVYSSTEKRIFEGGSAKVYIETTLALFLVNKYRIIFCPRKKIIIIILADLNKMIIIPNLHGFFSNYLRVLSYMICNNNELLIVFFFNIYLTNIDPSLANAKLANINFEQYENIWEIMFKPICAYSKESLNDPTNTIGWIYPVKNYVYPYPINLFNNYVMNSAEIYYSEHMPAIRNIYYQQYIKIQWSDYLIEYVKAKNNITQPDKTLAVFIRFPGHYNKYNNNYIEPIITELQELMKNYDFLYLVTNIEPYIVLLKEIFGDKIILFENKRIVPFIGDWVVGKPDLFKEYIDCFTEVYLASLCKFAIGGSSNMFMGCLIMNPRLEFKLFESIKNENGG